MTSKGNSTTAGQRQHVEKPNSLNELHLSGLTKLRRNAPDLRLHGRVLMLVAGAAAIGYGVYSVATFLKKMPSSSDQRVHDDLAQYFLLKEVEAQLKQKQQQK